MERLSGLLGMAFVLAMAYYFSTNRKAIQLKTVLWGLGLQIVFAIFVLKTDVGVRLFRVSDWTLARTLTGHSEPITGVAFAPDGQTLASSSKDRTVRLWRVGDGTTIRTLTGHTDQVSSVAFAGDGQTLVSGSFDLTARLWRVT